MCLGWASQLCGGRKVADSLGEMDPMTSAKPANSSLQRTVWNKVLGRGRAALALRPRNHARLAPRAAAELSR
jgi:hypothetical protein